MLFRRGRRGYELTEQGIALFERAQAVGTAANAFARLAAGATEQVAGSVRIAASEVVSAYVLPPIMARLGMEEPAHRGRDRRLQPGREPVAARCRYRRAHGRARPAGSRRAQDRRPAARRLRGEILSRPPRPARKARRSCSRTTSSATTAASDIIQVSAALGFNVDRHAFRFRTDNQIVYWEAIRAGNGIGFAQRPLAERDPLVETILPGLALPSLPMWLAMHRDVRTSARVRRVADFLFAELKRYAAG